MIDQYISLGKTTFNLHSTIHVKYACVRNRTFNQRSVSFTFPPRQCKLNSIAGAARLNKCTSKVKQRVRSFSLQRLSFASSRCDHSSSSPPSSIWSCCQMPSQQDLRPVFHRSSRRGNVHSKSGFPSFSFTMLC